MQNCPGGFCSHASALWEPLQALPLAQPPWLLRFPHLASLRDEFPGLPVFNEIVHNQFDSRTTKAFLDKAGLGADELRSRYHSTVVNNSAASIVVERR